MALGSWSKLLQKPMVREPRMSKHRQFGMYSQGCEDSVVEKDDTRIQLDTWDVGDERESVMLEAFCVSKTARAT